MATRKTRKTKRKYEVCAVALERKRVRGEKDASSDATFSTFGSELEKALNSVHDRGGRVMFVNYIENRGVLVAADMAPVQNPFGMMAIPLASPPHGDNSPELDTKIGQVMGGWLEYAGRTQKVHGSALESKELGEYLARAFADEDGEVISKSVQSLKAYTEHHAQNCTDEECHVVELFNLAAEKLRDILKVRLQ